jgi:hypothetical protein
MGVLIVCPTNNKLPYTRKALSSEEGSQERLMRPIKH